MRFIIFFWRSALWSLIIAVLCLLPGSAFKSVHTFTHFDKIVHFSFYAGLCLILIFDSVRFQKYHTSKINLKLIILLIPLFMGVTIEIIQHYFIKNRTFDLFDIFANLAGLSSVLFVFRARIKLLS